MHLREDKLSIEIPKRTRLSRNTVKKWREVPQDELPNYRWGR